MPKSMCFTEMLLFSLTVCELLHSRIQSEMETSAKSHGLTATISMDNLGGLLTQSRPMGFSQLHML